MKLRSQIDLTQGNAIKCLLLFAFPLFIENLINILYNVVDSSIIGQIIPNQYAGIADTSNLIGLATFFISACGMGFGAVVGYFFGAKNKEKTRQAIAKSYTLSLIIGVILSIIMVSLLEVLLNMLNLSKDIDYNTWYTARCYAFVIFVSLPITVVANTTIFSLRNLGNSTFPLITSVLSGFLNALLTFILVKFVDDIYWKVRCAAIATVFSQLVKFIICFIYARHKYEQFRFKGKDLFLDQEITKRLLTNSIPIGLEWVVIGFGLFFISGAVVSFDNAASASIGYIVSDAQNAYGASNNIKAFIYAFGGSLSGAIVSFTAQNYGAKQYNRLITSFKDINKLIIISYLILFGGVMLLTIKGAFLYIFLDASKINDNTVRYAFLTILFAGGLMFFKNINDVYSKALIGLEKPLIPSITGFVELAIRFFLVLLIRKIIPDPYGTLGFIIVVGAEPISWIASSTLSFIYARKAFKEFPKEDNTIIS